MNETPNAFGRSGRGRKRRPTPPVSPDVAGPSPGATDSAPQDTPRPNDAPAPPPRAREPRRTGDRPPRRAYDRGAPQTNDRPPRANDRPYARTNDRQGRGGNDRAARRGPERGDRNARINRQGGGNQRPDGGGWN